MAARSTLKRQVALRLGLALFLAAGFAAGLAMLIAERTSQRLFETGARHLAEHLKRSISRLEIDWEREAYNFKARLEYARVMEAREGRDERLFNFVTAQGGTHEFAVVALYDLGGRRLTHYAYNRERFPSAEFEAGDVGWAFDPVRAELYRVYRARIWLGADGNGSLHLYRPVDHAVMSGLAYPQTELHFFWGDAPVASSLGDAGLSLSWEQYAGNRSPGVQVQPWGEVSPSASSVVSASIPQAAFSAVELLEPVGLAMLVFAVTAWLAFGAWLTATVRRVGALGRAQAGFVAQRTIAPEVERALAEARRGGADELADTASSLAAMMRAVMEHERRQQESADVLRQSEERFRLLVEGAQAIAWELEPASGRLTYASARIGEALGFTAQEYLAPGFLDERVDPEDRERVAQARRAGETVDLRLMCRDGTRIWVRELASATGVGDSARLRGIWVDITESKNVEQHLRLAGLVVDTAAEGVMVTDAQNLIISVNPAFEAITGYRAEEAIGRDPKFLSSGLQGPAFYAEMWAALARDGRWAGEVWNRSKSGEFYAEHLSISTVRDDKGRVVRYLALFNDVTTEKRQAEKLLHQAGHDALTGLPNRRLLADRMVQAIQRAARDGSGVGIVMLDLDGFKHVNDSLGHRVGDLLLIETAGRLARSVRESDTVARVGGDEFVLMLPEVREQDDLHSVARKVLQSLSEPYRIEGSELFLSCSIGITLYPQDGQDPEGLLAHADSAMYLAKAEGKNTYQFFTRGMHDAALERLHVERDLRRALDTGQLELFLQPVVDLESGRVAHAEALVRWRHPERGTLSPEHFMDVAEDTGLVVPLGAWVLQEAVRLARRWRELAPPGFRVCVNLSPRQFRRGECTEQLRALLSADGRDAAGLALELTETLFLDERYDARRQLRELKELGLRLAIDDFGTGYSSLSYLKRFPVDSLKIDRAFVTGVPEDREDTALVEAILAMSRALGIDVVAEGVEREEQLRFLRSLGCRYGQGFLFGRPVAAAQFERQLQAAAQDAGRHAARRS